MTQFTSNDSTILDPFADLQEELSIQRDDEDTIYEETANRYERMRKDTGLTRLSDLADPNLDDELLHQKVERDAEFFVRRRRVLRAMRGGVARQGGQVVRPRPAHTRTTARARRSPSCARRAEADSGGSDPDPEPRPPALTSSPAPKNHRRKKYVRTCVGSADDPRVLAVASLEDGDDIYSRGPKQKSVCKISPEIIGRFAANGWARSQREADFFLRISEGDSVTRAAARVGVCRTTGYGWLHHAYRRIVEAGRAEGDGVVADEISRLQWQPVRRGRRRTRLVSRQPRSLRLRHLQYQQIDLLTGGAA